MTIHGNMIVHRVMQEGMEKEFRVQCSVFCQRFLEVGGACRV